MTEPNPPSLYARLGDTGIAQLVDRLYERMATLTEARQVWQMHHDDLTQTKARLRAFLSGWLGGPDRYTPQYGMPRMRRRHLAFSIGRSERDQWMLCLRMALDDTVPDAALRADLDATFSAMADHLRNRAETDTDPQSMASVCVTPSRGEGRGQHGRNQGVPAWQPCQPDCHS